MPDSSVFVADNVALPVTVDERKAYICPHSTIEYKGECPVTTCPANLCHTKANHASGCTYHYFLGRKDLATTHIQHLHKWSEAKVTKHYEGGMALIKRLVNFVDLLDRVREMPSELHCARCGVGRSSPSVCINVRQCTKRLQIANQMLAQFPLNIAKLEVTKKDFWNLLRWQKNWRGEYALNDLLGINESKMERLNAFRSFV